MKIAEKSFKNPDALLACRYFQEKITCSTNTQCSMFNLQIPSNQKTFYAKDWLKEKMFGFKS